MAESETTYARRTEATLVTRVLREQTDVCVTTRNLAETGEIEVTLPPQCDLTHTDMVEKELGRQGYGITYSRVRTIRVRAMLW